MLDIKKLLTKLLDYQKNEFTVDIVSVPCAFSSQRYKAVSASAAKTGYTPIGIVGWNCGSVDWLIDYIYVSGDTLYGYIFRTSSGTYSTTLKFYVLYRKDS